MSREKDTAGQEEQEQKPLRYVEELAGPEDAWVSITDAARITRTSEAMARRWVTTGKLPIKRQPVGINQHTRLVRLSDVATIRPIIDPSAAISDEVHKLDLPSIPRQQAQIMRDHERLLQQFEQGQSVLDALCRDFQALAVQQKEQQEELSHRLRVSQEDLQQRLASQQQQQDLLAAQIQAQIRAVEQVSVETAQLGKQFQQALEHVQTALLERLAEAQSGAQQGIEEVDRRLSGQITEAQRDLTNLLQQSQEQVTGTFQQIGQILGRTEQEVRQLQQVFAEHQKEQMQFQQDMTEQRQKLLELGKHVLTQREWLGKLERMLEQRETEQARAFTELSSRLVKLEQGGARLEGVAADVQIYQRRVEEQEQRLQLLTTQLQDERAYRELLLKHMTVQQEQLQGFAREIARLNVAKNGT